MSTALKVVGLGLVGAAGGVAAGYGGIMYCWGQESTDKPKVCQSMAGDPTGKITLYLWVATGALSSMAAVYLIARKRK